MPETELDFRALFERGPGLFVVLDPKLCIVAVSDAYCAATLTDRASILGRNIFDIFPDNPDEAGASSVAKARASFERVLLLRRPDAMGLLKYDVPRPDAQGGGFEERHWSTNSTPILDADGEVAWILVRAEDATDLVRTRSEEDIYGLMVREQKVVISQLRAANQQLAESSERIIRLQRDRFHLASIVDSSDDAILTKTLDGIVTSWNKAAERVFGYAAGEIVGETVRTLVPPDLLDEEEVILARLRSGQAIDHYETRRLRKDGEQILVSLTVSPLFDASGEVVGASKIARDVTERRRTEARLADLQSELIHLSRWNMMGMMAATMAHELNQPLAAIANYAAALQRIVQSPQQSPAVVDDILEKIIKQRERASQIVQRLRAQVARGTVERRAEGLGAVVAEALELATSTTNRAGAQMSLEVAPSLPAALVDRVQIQQVVINLVRNAVEAMERSPSRRIRVVVAPGAESGTIQVDVADSGEGLAEEVSNRLFQPFVTTKRSGMGLGLSICRNIIETHGGRLWAAANVPTGTVFSFTLPVHADQAAA